MEALFYQSGRRGNVITGIQINKSMNQSICEWYHQQGIRAVFFFLQQLVGSGCSLLFCFLPWWLLFSCVSSILYCKLECEQFDLRSQATPRCPQKMRVLIGSILFSNGDTAYVALSGETKLTATRASRSRAFMDGQSQKVKVEHTPLKPYHFYSKDKTSVEWKHDFFIAQHYVSVNLIPTKSRETELGKSIESCMPSAQFASSYTIMYVASSSIY